MIRFNVTGLFLAVALIAGCGGSKRPILIGWGGGPLNDSTVTPSLHAAELAIDEINRAGGIRGRMLQLLILEDGGEADSAVRVARRLVDSGVVAVIGHIYSSTTLAAAKVYNDPTNPVTQISPSATSPVISQAGPYTFRVCPSDLQYGGALAHFVQRNLKLSRGAVLYVNNDYGRGVRRTFEQEFARVSGEVTEIDPFLEGTPQVGAYLERISQTPGVDFLVLAANIDEGTKVLQAIRDKGYRGAILGGDGLDGIEDAGPIGEGVYVATVYLPSENTDRNRKFLAAYREKFPLGNPVDYSAAATYDIVYLLRDAMLRGGTDRKLLRDAVAAIGQTQPAFSGLTGSIAFDENGDVPQLNIQVGVVRNGTLRSAEQQ